MCHGPNFRHPLKRVGKTSFCVVHAIGAQFRPVERNPNAVGSTASTEKTDYTLCLLIVRLGIRFDVSEMLSGECPSTTPRLHARAKHIPVYRHRHSELPRVKFMKDSQVLMCRYAKTDNASCSVCISSGNALSNLRASPETGCSKAKTAACNACLSSAPRAACALGCSRLVRVLWPAP